MDSVSLFRQVHSGLGSKQQHVCWVQHWGFGGQHWGFGGQHWGFGGQHSGFGGQHGLHFGWSHIFTSFGGPRKKEHSQKESRLSAFTPSFFDPPTPTPTPAMFWVMTQTRAGKAGLDAQENPGLDLHMGQCTGLHEGAIFQTEKERSEYGRILPEVS